MDMEEDHMNAKKAKVSAKKQKAKAFKKPDAFRGGIAIFPKRTDKKLDFIVGEFVRMVLNYVIAEDPIDLSKIEKLFDQINQLAIPNKQTVEEELGISHKRLTKFLRELEIEFDFKWKMRKKAAVGRALKKVEDDMDSAEPRNRRRRITRKSR